MRASSTDSPAHPAPATASTPAPANAPPAPLPVTINGKAFFHGDDPDMPLLWFLRDFLRLTGAKHGCDDGRCGACTVHVDGKPARACQVPMKDASGRKVVTIEGLAGTGLHPLQQAFLDEDALLCGHCIPGQILAAAALLARKPRAGDEDIAAITHPCRCGAEARIRRAIRRAADASAPP